MLIDIDRYEAIMDELEDAMIENDPNVAKRVSDARTNYASGEGRSLRDFLKEDHGD